MNKEFLSIRIFFCFLFLHLTHSQIQINLYLTEWVNNSEKNNDLQHDCLPVLAPIYNYIGFDQIIYYCMGEWSSKWNIEENNSDPKFTFAELSKQNVTSQQLYFWSAPMDIIENYQFYLNQLPNSKNISMAAQLFYNCTLPNFGSVCQYTLNNYKPYFASLHEMLHDFSCWNAYEPATLTCYTHLQCNRGPSPSCLDWSEICDGKVDCLDNELDEDHCWQLEIHECNENEYRCSNGQCIPQIYFKEQTYPYDCLDRSDEPALDDIHASQHKNSCPLSEPTILSEDVSCTRSYNIYHNVLASSCIPERQVLLFQAMFSVKPNSVSDECWTAFKCIIGVPIPANSLCIDLCFDGTCDEIVRITCPHTIYASDVPIALNHVFLVYQNNNLKYGSHEVTKSMYVCYNDQHLYLPADSETQVLFNNDTCHLYISLVFHSDVFEPEWIGESISKLNNRLQTLPSWIYNDSVNYNKSTMYQCINSYKCISKHRLFDMFQDCFYNDDENIFLWDKNCSIKQNSKFFKCETTNECIPVRFLQDNICHCTIYDGNICDDEKPEYRSLKTEITFLKICDNLTHLYPVMIDGQNHTDETECDQWPCNNIYTRCDGFWNCLTGADELDCDPLPSLNCPSNNHICVSVETKKVMCLPMEKANGGKVDCIGAADEPTLCRSDKSSDVSLTFYCANSSYLPCLYYGYLCDTIAHCTNNDDEQSCTNDDYKNYQQNVGFCAKIYELDGSDITKAFCKVFYPNIKRYGNKYFKFGEIQSSSKVNVAHLNSRIARPPSITQPVQYYQQRCHRGLEIQVWLNKEKNLKISACLCPPSFYGDTCQFQNQRVTFTIGLYKASGPMLTTLIIVISLIDNSEERIIHSYEQYTILPKQHCHRKFHGYLLYSNRPKNQTKLYSVHIDIYEKVSLNYRGSVIKPLLFPFLPVHRLSFLLHIPGIDQNSDSCSNHQCINGKCRTYFNDPNNATFCQCNYGWSGRYCTIQHTCTCSSDSLCLGMLANNRSLCICPLNKMGDRCLLNNTLCQIDPHKKCLNGGQCMVIDPYRIGDQGVICICPKGYMGDVCEVPQIKIVVSFDKNILLPSSIRIHFITVSPSSPPLRGTTFKSISLGQTSTTIYWTYQFNIMLIELTSKNYYLPFVYKEYQRLNVIETSLSPSNHCLHINELFNETIINYHLIRHIKYYHIPCQTNTLPHLSCFYDDIYFCLCEEHGHQRQANCFEFDHNMPMNCSGRNICKNEGECFNEGLDCPEKSFCLCPVCFHGTRCQLSTYGFSASLDVILGYHIHPNVNLSEQPGAVLGSLILSVLITLAGMINGVLTLITFKNKKTRNVGCGIYLLCSAINNLLTMIIFTLKIWIFVLSQTGSIQNRLFLNIQCYSIDFLLRFGLTMDQWLTTCVAIERAYVTIKGVNFNKKKVRSIAKLVIPGLVLLLMGADIQDPINRHLFDEINEDEEKRIWCIVSYSSAMRIVHSGITIFHIIVPFIINLISAIIIIIQSSRQRAAAQKKEKYQQILKEQFQQHKNLLIGPIILMFLAIPRLIISFASGCMKSTSNSWLFLLGYFISLIPCLLTFILFVLPSSTYYEVFQKAVSRYRNRLRMRS